MFDFFAKLSRPVMLGAAGAAAGYLMGKSRKQKQQMALGYGAVGAVAGYASEKMMQENVETAVEAAEVAEAVAASGFGELEIMDGFGATASSTATPAAASSATPIAPAAAASTAAPSASPPFSRRFRRIPGRRRLPYRRLRYPMPAYRPAFRKPIAPRRIFRARGLNLPYRPLVTPQPRYRNAMRPYAPRFMRPAYRFGPRYRVRTGRNYYGPATTAACQQLYRKIQEVQSAMQTGATVYKRPGVELTAEEAPIYLKKLQMAYRQYCAQLGY